MTKRSDLKHDVFIETIGKITKVVLKQKEKAMWIGLAVLAGIVIIIFLSSRSQQESPEANLMYLEGIGLFSAGRFDQAENIFAEVSRKYPGSNPGKRAIYYLGDIYYLTKRYTEAIEQFERFLAKDKKDFLLVPSCLMGLGNSKEGLRDYEGALRAYEKIIQKHPKSPLYVQALLASGRTRGAMGDYEGAKKDLQAVLKNPAAGQLAEDARFYLGYLAPK